MAIKHVGVLGSGIMGSGISEVVARAGFEVVLRCRTQARADATLAMLDESLDQQVDRGRLDDAERRAMLGRVRVATDLADLGACDLVIETVIENLAVKKDVFARLDQVCRDGALLATNTSTLSIAELAAQTRRPDRVCGIHFFNPAGAMPLVELVRAACTSDETLVTARAFVESCGKKVVEVQDRPGFIVNALLFPYLNGAVKLLESGVATRDGIDAAMKGGCNFPMGPLELLDLVGLDTSLAILESLASASDDPGLEPAALLRKMVEANELGPKTGRGFYEYDR